MPDPFDQKPSDSDTREVILGRYRIDKRLGHGGMGEVRLAYDELLGRPVALKRLRADGTDAAIHRDTILREARRASHISDRRIAAIYDVVEHGDDVLLVMEYIPGLNFRQRMKDSISLDEFWDLATQSAEALAVAHDHGIIHRDIKPENLMLTPNRQVKVLDFGIAKAITSSGETATTRAAGLVVAGTPQYMSPEAHLGQHIDARTDIFSLGVVFYELLTSRRPFEGATYAAVADKVLHTEPKPVIEIAPACGSALSQLVARMMAKDKDERVASAAELMHELEQARAATGQPGVGDSTAPAAGQLPAAGSQRKAPDALPGRRSAARRKSVKLDPIIVVEEPPTIPKP